MFDDPAIIRALNEAAERQRVLFNFYSRERQAGIAPLEAVADDKFNRDLAVIRAVMERSR